VKEHTGLSSPLPDLFDRLYGSGFVIGVHNGNQYGRGFDGILDCQRIHQSLGVDGQKGHVIALISEEKTGVGNSWMFDGCGNDMAALV